MTWSRASWSGEEETEGARYRVTKNCLFSASLRGKRCKRWKRGGNKAITEYKAEELTACHRFTGKLITSQPFSMPGSPFLDACDFAWCLA